VVFAVDAKTGRVTAAEEQTLTKATAGLERTLTP
jgi:hypothetical protein